MTSLDYKLSDNDFKFKSQRQKAPSIWMTSLYYKISDKNFKSKSQRQKNFVNMNGKFILQIKW